jgi:hypothetical protein
MNTKENIIASLELAMKQILSVENLNVWISVRKRPITKILKEAGVSREYSAVIMEELKKLGAVEHEGRGIGMRYKIATSFIPDYEAVAKRCYENFITHKREYVKSTVTADRPGDNIPFRPKKSKTMFDFECEKPGKIIKCKSMVAIPHLGELKFMLVDNRIYQVKIVGIYYAQEVEKKPTILCDVKGDFLVNEVLVNHPYKKGISLKELYSSAEELCAVLLGKVVKYKG